jgi:hypothetical protein
MLLKGHTLLGKVVGADPVALNNSLAIHGRGAPQALSHTDKKPAAPSFEPETQETEEQLNNRLKGLMNKSKVVLFMKGSPDRPQCGFSRTIVSLLREQETHFDHFDIYTDEAVRQGRPLCVNSPF